jgi:hypothetical protein
MKPIKRRTTRPRTMHPRPASLCKRSCRNSPRLSSCQEPDLRLLTSESPGSSHQVVEILREARLATPMSSSQRESRWVGRRSTGLA